ncbi:MAG: catalase, partial [Verrucomicrobiota bacterium]|nr:catalase [Verrucomicrobiota bacterium]
MPKIKRPRNNDSNKKLQELAPDVSEMAGTTLTSNQGLPINDTNNTLKAGERGPSLLEDFLMREKITHFD